MLVDIAWSNKSNHMVQEKPKMIFVHWSAQGDLNTITNQIKNVLLTATKVPNAGGSNVNIEWHNVRLVSLP